jgi:hypothetical protein
MKRMLTTVSRRALIRGMTDSADASIMMLQGDRTYSFDANNVLSDNAAAYTANGYLQAGGADGIIDLGGNQGITITLPSIADSSTLTPQQARIDAVVVVDVTAIDITSSNERYTIKVLASNDPSFLTGVQEVAGITIGKGASGTPATQKDNTTGRYELLFTNEQANVKFQFIKLFLVVAGTTPSISVEAFLAVLPEP